MQTKMKNSNKRKLLLALVTALICVALATGGTLMLFTWRSGTATNTVTTGNVHFSFQESEDGGDTWLNVDDDAGLNINFSDGGNDFYPGDNVEKRAQITNNGEGNAYLKVEAKFTFATEADITTPPDWPDTADHQKIIMDALVKYWDTAGSRIYGPGFEVDTNSIVINNGEVSFTLYYVDNNNLLVFTPGTTAAVLDADIHLPTYAYLELATLSNTPPTVEFTDVPWGGDIVTLGYYEISDYLFDVQFGLELTVFAVQEKNNPYTSGYPWDVAFAGLSWTNQQ